MDIYHYHSKTSEYIGSTKAMLDPIDHLPLIPAHATSIAPPTYEKNQIPVFNNGAWEVRPDYRGHQYWLSDGSSYEIKSLGDTPPEGALSEAPPPPVTIDRLTFVMNCVNASILDVLNARSAVAGNWPNAFDSFIEALPISDQLDAIHRWKNADVVPRQSTLIAGLQNHIGLTDAQIDALFVKASQD